MNGIFILEISPKSYIIYTPLNAYNSRNFLNKISYTNSCLEIANRNGFPIYFSSDVTDFSCYVLDGEWHILNEGK